MKAILGVDVGSEGCQARLLTAQQQEDLRFDNTLSGFQKLRGDLKKRHIKTLQVCMEATGRYYEALADFLVECGYAVSVVNPARIKAYADSQLVRNKTDQLDAALIADFCRTQDPPLWTPPPPEWRELQALVRHLEDLQTDLQRQRNRLHALRHSAHPSPTVQANVQQQVNLLQAQIQQVKRAIAQHLDHHPDLKRDKDLLTSIPGIGDLTAGKLLAEFRCIRDFTDVRQLVAFAGLNPRHHQSGKSARGHTPISKQGRATIRATLFLPAVVAMTHAPTLQPLVARLQARGLSRMEIVVTVMRKLLHFIFGILKSGQPFDPHYLEPALAHA
jgi:transposase